MFTDPASHTPLLITEPWETLLVKTKAKKAPRISALSVSTGAKSLAPFSNGPQCKSRLSS